MAARIPFREILVNLEDVPGAVLPNEDPSANSVTSLQRFLQVRGVKFPPNSRKAELVQMVVKYSSKPVDNSVDRGKWLEAKSKEARRRDLNEAVDNDFDFFPVFGWKTFPSVDIPSLFNYGLIYHYIIETRDVVSDDSEDDSSDELSIPLPASTKPLSRGKRYFISGHVGEMTDSRSSKGHYCLKAKIQASMNNIKYNVMIMLNGTTALVMDASCECKASAMARCSHVGALLLALEDYSLLFGHTAKACTSKLCAWNQGRKTKQSHPINQRQYTCKRDPSRATDFTVFEPMSAQSTIDRLKYNLELLAPHSVWASVLQYCYEDYELSEERVDVLIHQRKVLLEQLKFKSAEPSCITGTEGQSISDQWHRVRRILITASNFQQYLREGGEQKKLMLLMYEPSKLSNVYVKYGQEHEEEARAKYTEKTGNDVMRTGLWVNPNYPGLGASPDGLVHCTKTRTTGILEIKCPYVLRNHSPSDINVLTAQQRYAYCLKWQDGHLKLSKDHKYNQQIQMQLGITGAEWCDFVVWTKKEILIERIYRDQEWWENTAAALQRFHAEFVCAEYFEVRVPRGLAPVRLPVVYH